MVVTLDQGMTTAQIYRLGQKHGIVTGLAVGAGAYICVKTAKLIIREGYVIERKGNRG